LSSGAGEGALAVKMYSCEYSGEEKVTSVLWKNCSKEVLANPTNQEQRNPLMKLDRGSEKC